MEQNTTSCIRRGGEGRDGGREGGMEGGREEGEREEIKKGKGAYVKKRKSC